MENGKVTGPESTSVPTSGNRGNLYFTRTLRDRAATARKTRTSQGEAVAAVLGAVLTGGPEVFGSIMTELDEHFQQAWLTVARGQADQDSREMKEGAEAAEVRRALYEQAAAMFAACRRQTS